MNEIHPARVVLAEQRPAVRSALRLIVTDAVGMQVVAEVAEATELWSRVQTSKPQVLLLDWDMVATQAGALVAALHATWPDLYIVALGGRPEAEADALAAGADISFVNNDSSFLSLTVNAAHDITFDTGRKLTTTGATGSIDLTAGTLISAAGPVTLQSKDGIVLHSDLTSNGLTTLDADSDAAGGGTFQNFGALNTTNGALSIKAADIDLPGSLNSGAATTTITSDANQTIGLGAGAGTLQLSKTANVSAIASGTADRCSTFRSADHATSVAASAYWSRVVRVGGLP